MVSEMSSRSRHSDCAWATLWLELLWTKQRILEVYLNVVQFGPCVFGAEAAAQRGARRRRSLCHRAAGIVRTDGEMMTFGHRRDFA